MKLLKSAAGATLLLVAASVQAAPLPYSGLLVFGDSLVDSGNAQIGSAQKHLPDPAPASAGYFGGRFSNGYNFADDLSLKINGQPATAYLAGGSNFAVGGATAAYDLQEQSDPTISPSFLSQLGIFQQSGQKIAADELVLVTFGGNDVRAELGNFGPVDFKPTTDALTTGLRALIGAGARNIVVTGLPDIGLLPSVRAKNSDSLNALATERSRELNQQFADLSFSLSASTGADIEFFDLFGFEHRLIADPAAFTLPADLNTTTTCQSAGAAAVLGGCKGFLYFDGIHPTAAVHGVIADAIGAELTGAVPEPASWAMLIAGFGLIGSVQRRARAVRFSQA